MDGVIGYSYAGLGNEVVSKVDNQYPGPLSGSVERFPEPVGQTLYDASP